MGLGDLLLGEVGVAGKLADDYVVGGEAAAEVRNDFLDEGLHGGGHVDDFECL